MRILICAALFQPHIGGYEKNIEILAKRLVKSGHEVDILTCNTNNSYAYEGSVKEQYLITRLPTWNLLNGAYPVPSLSMKTLRMLKRVFDYKYDVVITQTRFFVTSLLGYLISDIKRIPLIAVERGTCHSVVQNKVVGLINKLYDHTVGTLIVKSAKVNVGVSQAAADFVKHLGGKARVIYNGIECDRGRTEITINPVKERYIIFVGRLIYAKGVQDLIEAFAILIKERKDLRLRIVGDGNYYQELIKQRNQLPYDDWNKVTFYGERKDVIDLLEEADIFVNPSYSEGLPTSVMEAASVGLPIIATDVGGTREIIKNGESGLLIKPGQPKMIAGAIKVLLHDERYAKVMGMRAKITVMAKFNWDYITHQYQSLLKEVCK
jgi:glycosyltransferase involved in cell wall biosynthesis